MRINSATASRRVSAIRVLHWLALAALRWVMLDISSRDELVSSSEAACWLAPSAKDWLAADTWPAAAAVCSAPALKVSAMPCKTLVMLRLMKRPKDALDEHGQLGHGGDVGQADDLPHFADIHGVGFPARGESEVFAAQVRADHPGGSF